VPQPLSRWSLRTARGVYRRATGRPAHCDQTGLFRILADVKLTPAGILDFANRYGWLGHTRVAVHDPNPRLSDQSATAPGETWMAWVDAIASLRLAVRLWEMARKGDAEGLAPYVHWADDDVVYCFSDPQWMHANPTQPLPPGERCWTMDRRWEDSNLNLRPGDRIVPARCAVQFEMNQHLSATTARLLWNRKHTQQELCFAPPHLMAAVWLQFAQAVDGNKGYRNCQQCGRWFELSPQAGRADKRFCRDACRSRASRERQQQAVDMYQGGKPVAEIAQTLQSSTDVVRRWIKQSPRLAPRALASTPSLVRSQS